MSDAIGGKQTQTNYILIHLNSETAANEQNGYAERPQRPQRVDEGTQREVTSPWVILEHENAQFS